MTYVNIIVLCLLGFFILLKVYVKFNSKWCESKVCLVGKTIIVTGANTGIGYESALEFAKRGARVILGCRDEARAIQARDKIIRETRNKNVVVKLIDTSSLKSVRNFAKNILETEDRLDVLVNNAGIVRLKPAKTEDGLDSIMQVNYFGPFLLTVLLAELLKKSAPSRIVNVSSIAAAYANLDVDKISEFAGKLYAYNNTKLCNILFTMHLAKLLEKHDVSVYSLHPGAVNTEVFREVDGFMKYIFYLMQLTYFKTSEEGAQTTIHTATAQKLEIYTGRHFYECQVVKTYSTAANPELPKKLWEKTVEVLKCQEEVKKL